MLVIFLILTLLFLNLAEQNTLPVAKKILIGHFLEQGKLLKQDEQRAQQLVIYSTIFSQLKLAHHFCPMNIFKEGDSGSGVFVIEKDGTFKP